MKRSTKIVATVAAIGVASLIGTQVLAHGPGSGYGMGPGMMMGGPMMGQGYGQMPMGEVYDQAWLDALKEKLAISPQQETAWTAYAQALTTATQAMIETHSQMNAETVQKMAPDELRTFMQGMHEQRLDQMVAVAETRDALFKVLDERQTRLASTTLGGPGMGYGMMGYGMGPGMMGPGGVPCPGYGTAAPSTE